MSERVLIAGIIGLSIVVAAYLISDREKPPPPYRYEFIQLKQDRDPRPICLVFDRETGTYRADIPFELSKN
jgi:hypothetical protein